MSDLTIGLLSALLATNQPQAVSNLVQEHTGISVPLANANDPAEQELRNLMIADDAALDEVNALDQHQPDSPQRYERAGPAAQQNPCPLRRGEARLSRLSPQSSGQRPRAIWPTAVF